MPAIQIDFFQLKPFQRSFRQTVNFFLLDYPAVTSFPSPPGCPGNRDVTTVSSLTGFSASFARFSSYKAHRFHAAKNVTPEFWQV